MASFDDESTPFTPKTIIEPFRIHSVEPLKMTTHAERMKFIKDVGYNLFSLSSTNVIIDFLTDSGTGAFHALLLAYTFLNRASVLPSIGAMSRDQWAAIQHGDESYAGSPSWDLFRNAVAELFPFKHILPTHQVLHCSLA